jgi:hypothetical protein
MVVNNYGYYLGIAQVTKVEPETSKIEIRMMQNDPILTDVVTEDSKGYKIEYVSLYNPNLNLGKIGDAPMDYYRLKDQDAFNVPTGFFNIPKKFDYLLIAVYLQRDPNTQFYRQNMDRKVLVLGQIQRHQPLINSEDNILIDRSGAKLHFNHQWFDSENLELPSGHTTLVGNRLVSLSGRKFLNFSLLSFLFQRGIKSGATTHDPILVLPNSFDEENSQLSWSELFTRNINSTKLFDPQFSGELQKLGEKLFLEPPCPPNDAKQDMHDSGWKEVVYGNGNTQQFLRSRLRIVGAYGLPYSFAPNGMESFKTGLISGLVQAEVDQLKESVVEALPDAQDKEYHADGTSVIATEKNVRGSGLEEQVREGILIQIPASTQTSIDGLRTLLDGNTEKAEAGKYKIVVGSIVIVVDKTAGTVDITDGTNQILMNSSSVKLTDGSVTLLVSGGVVDVS